MVWDRDQIFPQLDLLLLNHFDNKARMTSLKALEVAMKSPNVKDLPFPVGMVLNDAQKDELITYNIHDVRETTKFMMRCLSAIQFREELCQTHGRNFMNHNDTKIGKDYFVMELEKNGIQCFNRDTNGRKLDPRQTPRESICFADVIFQFHNEIIFADFCVVVVHEVATMCLAQFLTKLNGRQTAHHKFSRFTHVMDIIRD
jgi:hypothetical protein